MITDFAILTILVDSSTEQVVSIIIYDLDRELTLVSHHMEQKYKLHKVSKVINNSIRNPRDTKSSP